MLMNAQGKAQLLDTTFDAANDGGPNDTAWLLWVQFADLPAIPSDCNPDLMSRNGVNGWATEPEARTVLAAFVGQANAVNATVDKANQESLGKSVKADADAVASAAKDAAKSVAPTLGAGLFSATALYVAGAVAGAYALYRWLRGRA